MPGIVPASPFRRGASVFDVNTTDGANHYRLGSVIDTDDTIVLVRWNGSDEATEALSTREGTSLRHWSAIAPTDGLLTLSLVSVTDISVGQVLASAPKGATVSGLVVSVEARADIGAMIVRTDTGEFALNPFGSVIAVTDTARPCDGIGHSAYVADDFGLDEAREEMLSMYAELPTGDHPVICPWCDHHVYADAKGILLPHDNQTDLHDIKGTR